MGATTTEGTGAGAVINIYPKIINDVVKSDNLTSNTLENLTGDILSTGTLTVKSGNSNTDEVRAYHLNLLGGTGVSVGDSDGGDVVVFGGSGNDSGEGGDVFIRGGICGVNATRGGFVDIRGANSDSLIADGGYINVIGGSSIAEGGSVTIAAGNGENGGNVNITSGSVNLTSSTEAVKGQIIFNGITLFQPFADAAERDANIGIPVSGMMAFLADSNTLTFYIGVYGDNGEWKTISWTA